MGRRMGGGMTGVFASERKYSQEMTDGRKGGRMYKNKYIYKTFSFSNG